MTHYYILFITMFVSLSLFANNNDDYEGFEDLADPSEYVYGDCIWCPSEEFGCMMDSTCRVEISEIEIASTTTRVVVTNEQSYIYNYEVRFPFSGNLLGKYMAEIVYSKNKPFLTGTKKLEMYVIGDYFMNKIQIYRGQRLCRNYEYGYPYDKAKGIEYVYSDDYSNFWGIVSRLGFINKMISKYVGLEGIYDGTYLQGSFTAHQIDSVSVTYRERKKNVPFRFHFTTSGGQMECDSLPGNIVHIGNYMGVIAIKGLCNNPPGFVKVERVVPGKNSPIGDNIEIIDFKMYSQGKILKQDTLTSWPHIGDRYIRYSEMYYDFLKLIRNYVFLYRETANERRDYEEHHKFIED